MKFNRTNRNGANQTRRPARPQRLPQSAAACALEPLEGRQLFSVTGFSLVNDAVFPGPGTTVVNQPTVFQTQLDTNWQSLVSGKTKIAGQTIQQKIASTIQGVEHEFGLSAYDISTYLDWAPNYNGSLKTTSSGAELQLTFDAVGNQTDFTSTTNSILGSWADPHIQLYYNLDLSLDVSIPSNLVTGKVTATASAAISDFSVSASILGINFANHIHFNVPASIESLINSYVSSGVPTGLLDSAVNGALKSEVSEGYTHLFFGLDSGGDLVLTAQNTTLTVNGGDNDHISISSGSGGSIVIAAGGQTHTYAAGLLKKIIVNDAGYGTNTVNIPSLPSGIAVQVDDSGTATDNVTVGASSGSLASVAGTVSVSNSSTTTNLTVDNYGDPAASQMTVTKSAVEFNGRSVVTYSTATNSGQDNLTVEGGKTNNVYVDSTSTPLSVIGLGTFVCIGTSSSSLSAIGGPLTVENFGEVSIIDSNDSTSRTVTLSSVTGGIFTSSTVAFQGLAAMQFDYAEGVTIFDGTTGKNTYDALSSPSNDFFEVLGHTGDKLIGPAASQVEFVA